MDHDLLEVARTIRPYLEALAGDEARSLDGEIASLLEAAASGVDVDERVADVLSRSLATRNWAAGVLEDPLHRPPELQPVAERSFDPLPGEGAPVPAEKYLCPVDRNYVWWRRSASLPIPDCPDHHTRLVRA